MKSTASAATMIAGLRRWLSRVGGHLLPARCLLCGADDADDALGLCPGCRDDLPANTPCCPRCAEPLVRPEPLCGRCLRRPPPFTSAWAPLRYQWPLDGLITRFKFGADLAAGRCLAQVFVDTVRNAEAPLPDLLVPVPLHRSRLRRRGHDQALELTRDIGRGLGVPVAPNLLQRVRATQAQTELDLRGRRRNVRGAFMLDPRQRQRLPSTSRIAVLDDVMTSGSTLAECTRVLHRAGFAEVQVWAIARAPAARR